MVEVCVARHEPATFGRMDVSPFAQRPNQGQLLGNALRQRSQVRKSPSSRPAEGIFGSTATTITPKLPQYQRYRESLVEDANQNSRGDNRSDGVVDKEAVDISENEEDRSSANMRSKADLSPHYDAEVESLISRINEKIVIRDVAVQDPLWLHVPRGYVMEQAISPTDFYRTRHEVKTHANKRKRALGPLPKQLRRGSLQEQHGFQAQEVNRNGAVHLQGCRPSNLTNTIHPLFDRSCFDDIPDAIYDQLIPGLQLATMFLTQPICMQFWVTLAMGLRRDDAEMSAHSGKQCQRIDSHVELTLERALTMIERIKKLGKSKLIHFRFKRRLASNRSPEGVWGLSDPICDYRGLQKEFHGQQGPLIRSIIRLHGDYYIVARKLSKLRYPEVSQKLRFNFQFAVLIMHELTHSIEGIHIRDRGDQWIDWQNSRFYREPYWLDWQDVEHASELGRAWEETMFGGEISPINHRIDGSHGIGTSDWPPRGRRDDPDRRIWFTVSMEYIEHMFQMETWRQSFDLKQWRVFNIPRDGAISLYINSFTTMSWEEEQRVAKEEIAELVALENEQPAKKKRIKGEGRTEERRLGDEEVIGQAIEEQEHRLSDDEERQVLIVPVTRRHSSPVLSPLPDNGSNRMIMTPQTPKPLVPANAITKSQIRPRPRRREFPRPRRRAGRIPDSLEASQRNFIQEQHLKDKERRTNDALAKQKLKLERAKIKRPTSELIKEIKSRPMGLMDRYRLKRKAGFLKKQAEEKKKHELSEKKSLQVKEELMAASKGVRGFEKGRAQSA